METKKEALQKIESLEDGDHVYVNMFQDGGACIYKCNGMYLLFEITQYGINEYYEGTYFENQLNDLLEKVYSWS